jgi:hypothetical protein
MIGATIEDNPRRVAKTVISKVSSMTTRSMAKQSTLDSLFAATMQLNAVKEIKKNKKTVDA